MYIHADIYMYTIINQRFKSSAQAGKLYTGNSLVDFLGFITSHFFKKEAYGLMQAANCIQRTES